MCDLNIYESKTRWIIGAWNQIFDLWILKWFSLRLDMSNQIFAELRWTMVQYVESDLHVFSTCKSRLLCLFCSFLRTCTDECFFSFFFDEFHAASVFVLLLIAIWGLLYDIGSGLFSCLAVFFCLTNVKIRCVWMKLKVPRRIRRK